MPKISRIRPVLLSAPYATPGDLEVLLHLPSGYRTTGLVEVTLEDGTTGVGEGYLAVFAPKVFVGIVELIAPYLLGKEALEVAERYREMCGVCDYWSLQGAARHVTSALEMALWDAAGKHLGLPVYALLGRTQAQPVQLYGSGGDATHPLAMRAELERLQAWGIGLFKIRARAHQVAKTVWTMRAAEPFGLEVAVDMTQNLANPAQPLQKVLGYLEAVEAATGRKPYFLEESLGPFDSESLPRLRQQGGVRVAGGETVTTAAELCLRVGQGCYDWVQPDASVVGGLGQTLEVFEAARQHGAECVVHSWGGGVSLMANYHAAFAGGATWAEWPMKPYALRDELLAGPLEIRAGNLRPPVQPGLGVRLSPGLEARYPFREDAVYACLVRPPALDEGVWG
ncbi:MAG: mandelate racemase/muconate lactonizing enzyme family protein [Meiothermus sp.]|nr:mandelate racemase/muconate lactonizing enzyme family protein [Meiothermus sp.]